MIMRALPTMQVTYKLSCRMGAGMMVDLDPPVGAGLVMPGEDI